jgi:hypothetical protein
LLIFIKKILNFIIYNCIAYNISKNYITLDKLLSYRLSELSYSRFLIKNLIKKKIKLKKFKLIYIYLFTILYELSASCWNLKRHVLIKNEIEKLNLIKLFISLNYLLPTGFPIKIYEKSKMYNSNIKSKFTQSVRILLTSNHNTFEQTKKKNIFNYIIYYSNNFDFKIFRNNLSEVKVINNLFINKILDNNLVSLNQLKSNIIVNKIFIKKNFFIFVYKEFIYNFLNSNFIRNKKFRIYSRNVSTINIIKDVVLRYHGLIFVNNKILNESIKDSWYDNNYLGSPDILDYKIDQNINDQCLVLSTGTNSLGHYLFESIIKLYYVKNNNNIKIIINNKISKDIIEILLSYGFKKNQILIKPIFENWRIKELVLPSLAYFEMSKQESNFLSRIDKKSTYKIKNFYDKIYISRRDATDSRNLINEIEIEEFLKSQGYKIILTSDIRLNDKIEILSNAKIIITPVGAGIHNVYFCKRIKAKVILIGTKRYFHQKYFLQLSYFKKIKLYFVQSAEILSFTRDFGYLHSSFYLDLKILKEAIKKLDN